MVVKRQRCPVANRLLMLSAILLVGGLLGCSGNSTTEGDSPSASVESKASTTPAVDASVPEQKAPDCTKERLQLEKYEGQIQGIKATFDDARREADRIMAKEDVTEADQARLYQLGDKAGALTEQLKLVGAKRDALRRVMEDKGCSMY